VCGVSHPLPLYWRVLSLRRVRPGPGLRVALVEGLLVLAVLLSLAGTATPWAFLVLPVVGALIVKAHDLLARSLPVADRAMTPRKEGSAG
jgi:hypothetical protein